MNATLTFVLTLLAAAASGWALGALYFRGVRHSVALYTERGAVVRAVAFTLARIAAAALLLLIAARLGLAALIGVFSGFLLARLFALRAARRTS